ncbi:MAG: VWA domain-containing protein [Deltaproteobacteria bacterium]|nr:VWA domain-containing protein [Deltaproteobacteria bacterium]
MAARNRIGFALAPLALLACLAWGAPARAQCVPPQVLIVLDKSSSMVTGYVGDPGLGVTKWMAATAAVESLVTSYEDRIDFGLMVFPYTSECQPGQVVAGIGSDSAAIVAALVDPPPEAGNWTPMSQSLDAAAAYAPLLDPSRDNFVLLVTDGWQWCDPYDAGTRFDPVDSVDALEALGVTTFVLGFGYEVDAWNNNLMAVAGGTDSEGCNPDGSDPYAEDLCYFQTASQEGLEAAFDEIALELTAEECNGEDDDCDGFADNQTEGSPDPLVRTVTSACGGTCESVCSNAAWSDCVPEGPCDDGDACTADDWCTGDVCTGEAVDCDDGNPCTDDGCDPASGCTTTPNNDPCDDGDPCTLADACADGQCSGVPIDCSDGVDCTLDSCQDGSCVNSPDDSRCDDGDPCTADTCTQAGCTHSDRENQPCDDGNACTENDACDEGGFCIGVLKDCDDGNPCTDDSCDPERGCDHVANRAACDDGDPCTEGDACAEGTCIGGRDICGGEDGDPEDCGCGAGAGGSPVWLLVFLLVRRRRA